MLLHCGPCCAPPTFTHTVNVKDCAGVNFPGVSVTMDGVTVVTNGSGNSVFTVAAGTYTITVTAPAAYYNGATPSVTIASSGLPSSTNVTLTPATGYVCCGGCTNKVVPTTLYVTDSNGTWTVTNTGGCNYSGTGTATKKIASVNVLGCPGAPADSISGTSGSMAYGITVSLGLLATVNVSAFYVVGRDAGTCFGGTAYWCAGLPCPTGTGVSSTTAGASASPSGSCSPTSVSYSGSFGSWSYSGFPAVPSDGPPVTGSVTVTS